MPKKILTIAIVLLVLTALILIGYNFGLKKPKVAQEVLPLNNQPSNKTIVPTSSQINSAIQVVSKEKAFWPVFNADKNKILYFNANGNLFESDADGKNINKISSLNLKNLVKIIWPAANKEKVLAVFSETGVNTKYLYDYNNNTSLELNSNIEWLSWSPDNKQIVYQYRDLNGNSISTSDPNGLNWKNIPFKTTLDGLIIEWPKIDKISIRQKPSGFSTGFLYAINPKNGDFKKIISDMYGLSTSWSPKADKVLFSYSGAEGKGLTLSLSDENGNNIKKLDITTIAEKCVWTSNNKNIICAVPKSISKNAIWPDDYYKGKIIITDDFYQVNVETGNKTKIFETDIRGFIYDAQNLFLSPKEDYLFFINKTDGKLYRLKVY